MKRDALIPSMFHRRLVLLVGLFALPLIALVTQLFRLTVVQGADHLLAAERVLVSTEYLPTYRGRIVDRHGRPVAAQRPCFDVLVDYRVISGEWAVTQAGREARRTHRETWDELSRARRDELIEQYRGRYERDVQAMWRDLATISGKSFDEVIERRDSIYNRVEYMAGVIHERWRVEREKQYQVAVSIEEVARPIREQEEPHVILEGIEAGEESRFRELAQHGPQLSDSKSAMTVRTSGVRTYDQRAQSVTLNRSTLPGSLKNDDPMTLEVERVAALIVGTMRDQVNAQELSDRPLRGPESENPDLGGYGPEDAIGSTGMERTYESVLRGSRGVRTLHFDGSPNERIEPIAGRDVQLTIDMQLQARVQGILDPRFGLTRVQPWHGDENELPLGTNLAAGAVVIEIASGDILAMVTSPTQMPTAIEAYRSTLSTEELSTFNAIYPNPEIFHRAAQVPYAPGSIVKPLFFAWAASHANWPIRREVNCNGHYLPEHPNLLRCWIYRPPVYAVHGPLDPVGAIGRSCNIYFYTIADAVGLGGVRRVYQDWGMGAELTLGMPVYDHPIESLSVGGAAEIPMLGIGQGPVSWTPVRAAAAYAALARGGVYVEPALVADASRAEKRTIRDLELTDESVNLALSGLHEVVNNQVYGGARHIDIDPPNRVFEPVFNVPGTHVWGKTGTAQQRRPEKILLYNPDGSLALDSQGKPIIIDREGGIGAHSWFVGLAGPEDGSGRGRPQFAVAVIVEWGGSGSRCAGPVANQIFHALKTEGYLP